MQKKTGAFKKNCKYFLIVNSCKYLENFCEGQIKTKISFFVQLKGILQ